MRHKKHNTFFSGRPATFLIILTNVFTFFIVSHTVFGERLFDTFLLSPYNLFIKRNITCLITSGFLHKDVPHLLFNMAGVFIFGSIVEKRFGAIKTAAIYCGALVLSMFFAVGIYTFVLHKNVAIVGASGALMGLISCAMLADPFKVTREILVPVPVMFKGWFFFYADIKGFLTGETDGVSHLAHLAGFLSIAIIIYFLDKKDRNILVRGLVVNVVSFALFMFLRKLV